MALSSGTRLGAYEIVAAVGAGGMGEVYRARDTRLQRDVAIKILPDLFAADADRLARFEREARMLAALNHPHIAQVFGIEESGKTRALIMEFVDGEDLSERLARAGALPLDEAVPIARQIAEALEAAHEQGIIHRDLKPANVKVRADGTVKVLDFGLAKPLGPEAAGGQAEAMNSPTITSPFSMSALGVILGTAAYMAPEQAKGKPVDKRSDIWAFGCVLYELLTGERAFKGEDISDTLAAVLRQEIDLHPLPASTPPSLRRLIARCLERNPRQRLRDIGEARIELARIESGAADAAEAPTVPGSQPMKQGSPAWLPWTIAAIAAIALVAVLLRWAPWAASPAPPTIRLTADVGADVALDTSLGAAAIISPDGRTLVFTGARKLFVRKIDQLQAAPLAGTENASNPFFSFDGQSVGFFATGRLKRIGIAGGAAATICPTDGSGRGGWWADDDTIVFQSTTRPAALMRVSASGGTAAPLGRLMPGELGQRWPQVLPGSKAVLYTSNASPIGFDDANIIVQPLSGGAPKVVVHGGFYGRYVTTGHILYLHESTLFAQPFDLDRLEPSGRAMPVVEGVLSAPNSGGAQFAISATGTLVYFPGQGRGPSRPISWVNRTGEVTPLRSTPADWINPRFSPDGRELAMSIVDSGQLDVWTYDWQRDTAMRLTFDPATDMGPFWTPDGKRIVFSSDRAAKGTNNIYWTRANGVGGVQRLTDSPNTQIAWSMHPTGKWLALQETRPSTAGDVMILPIEGDESAGWKPGKPREFVATAAHEIAPMFSPDGRWIAYMSSESGNMQVYVRPFPEADGKWQVSTEAGVYPMWSRTGLELLFLNPLTRKIMVSSYAVEGTSFHADKPREWSPRAVEILGTTRMLDLHPDGNRVATVPSAEADAGGHDKVVFIFNFFDTLNRAAPRH